MKTPADIREELARKFRRHRRLWFKDWAEGQGLLGARAQAESASEAPKPAFPLSLTLGIPSEKTVTQAG